LLRRSSQHALYYVYVVDREGRLIGVVNLRQLLLTSSKQSLQTLMRRPVYSLPPGADHAGIVAHPGWRELHALPVVDGSGRFLGVLRHETVRRLEEDRIADKPYDQGDGQSPREA
jgi:magnesium transporter